MRVFCCRFLVFLFIALQLSSCEEIIQLDLNPMAEKYVIEATLSNVAGDAKVMLSKTKGLNSSNDFIGISGALVEIINEQGVITLLKDNMYKGIYTHPTLKGTPGQNYQLKVAVDGQVFSSSGRMPDIVPLDSVYPLQMNLLGGMQWFTQVKYNDPVGVRNFYRFIENRNDHPPKNVFITNDDLTDGRTVIQTIFSSEFSMKSKLKPGENVTLEFQSINEDLYKYWYSVNNGAKGNSDSAAPTNPLSNIKGGAIGYFSVHSTQKKSYIVP